jgi:hypothetical protein
MKKAFILLFTIISIGLTLSCSSAATEKTTDNKSIANKPQVNSAKSDNKKVENTTVQTTEEAKKDELIEVWDGRKFPILSEYPAEITNLVQAEFDKNKDSIKQKMEESYCVEETGKIGISGIEKGSFTKPNSNQKAAFYILCSSGSSHFGVGGIIIFENDKVVSHYVYGENGIDNYTAISPDVNKNGLNELILVNAQTHQGISGGMISLVEFADGKLNFIGMTSTYSSNSGAVEDEKDVKSSAYKIMAQPSANPIFFRETFEMNGEAKDWKLVKKSEKISLEKIEEKYLKGYQKITN